MFKLTNKRQNKQKQKCHDSAPMTRNSGSAIDTKVCVFHYVLGI